MRYLIALLFCISAGASFQKTFAQAGNWQSVGIGGGGALFAPSVNPVNPREMYVSCDMSQTFHSTDGGRHWKEIPFGNIQGGHDGYISFTKDPNVRYTVNYYSHNGQDFIKPMKSTDGGNNWAALSGDPYASNPSGYILRLFADYDKPDRLVLADYGTIYFSNDGGSVFTKIHSCINNGSGNHIAGVFFDGDSIYIGTNDGLILSTNGGSSFSTLSTTGMGSGEYMLSFAGARKGSTLKLVCLTSSSVWAGFQYGSDYSGALKSIYTMDNLNGTWVSKISGINKSTDYPVFVGMAENCTDTIYAAGGSSSSAPLVLRSVGSGNWTSVFSTASNGNIKTAWAGAGGDHAWSFPEALFGFEVSKRNANVLLISDYSCVHKTTNGGVLWEQCYADSANSNAAGSNITPGKKYHGIGLENTTNWQLLFADSNHFFAAFSDINGIMSDDKGNTWKFIPNLTQNSVYRIVKHQNGKLYAAVSNVHDMYQTTRIYDAQINAGKGSIWSSADNGNSFQLLHDFQHPVVWIASDPGNSDRMYASVLHSNKTSIGGIWVTNNLSAGTSSVWTKIPGPTRSNGHPYNITVLPNGNLLVSFSARKPTSGTQFTDSSGVFLYNPTSGKWFDRSHANMKYYTKDVVADPNDAGGATWYACVFSGWGSAVPANTGGLYKTTDTGLTWTKIANSYRVDGVAVEPGKPDVVYFSTETDGLFYSKNASNSSPTFSLVSDYPFRHPMRIYFNPWKTEEVWVTSFGSGLMKGSGVATGSVIQHRSGNEQAILYPNPCNDWLYMNIQSQNPEAYSIFGLSGQMLQNGLVTGQNGIGRISVSALPAGMYVLRTNQIAIKFSVQ